MKVLSQHEILQISGGLDPFATLAIMTLFSLGWNLYNTFQSSNLQTYLGNVAFVTYLQEVQLSKLPFYDTSVNADQNTAYAYFNPDI